MGNPTVTPLYEKWHDGGFIVSEANGHLSRDQVTLLSGTAFLAGMVLGKITTGLTASVAAFGTNTGNGVFGAVTLVTVPTIVGTYTLIYTDATHFTVTAPNGSTSTGVNGTGFSALGIGLTMTTAGATNIAGDGFNIVVASTVGTPTATATAFSTNTGGSTCSAVNCTGYAPKVGVYKVFFDAKTTDLGTFEVMDPDGQLVGDGVVATAFSGGGISFTIADGSNDFIVGDSFAVTVAAGSGKYTVFDQASVIGAQVPAGVLIGSKDATSADQQGVIIARQAEVNGSELLWKSGMTAASIVTAKAQLANLGIIAR